jgi:ankyrin repeat protein
MKETRVDVNAKDMYGGSPFYSSGSNDNINTMKLLMQYDRADLNAINDFDKTTFITSCEEGKSEFVKCLIKDNRVNLNINVLRENSDNYTNHKNNLKVTGELILKQHTILSRAPKYSDKNKENLLSKKELIEMMVFFSANDKPQANEPNKSQDSHNSSYKIKAVKELVEAIKITNPTAVSMTELPSTTEALNEYVDGFMSMMGVE